MRRVLLVVCLFACKKNEPAAPPPPPAPAPKVAPAPPPCDLAGAYRVRFASNGEVGWWLPFAIDGSKAQLTKRVSMFALDPGPLDFKGDGCTGHITAHSENAGLVTLDFTLDPKTNAVTGTLTREKGGDDNGTPAKQAIKGRRDVGGLGGPACLHAGVFRLEAGKAKWKLSEGEPSAGLGCNDDNSPLTTTTVRIQPFGDEIAVDSVAEGANGFTDDSPAGEVKRLGDCDLELKLGVQDYDFTAKLTLAGDKLAGTASDAHYTFFEDGDAGENMWSCKAKNVPITGTRIAD
jgi:hypothetical protein